MVGQHTKCVAETDIGCQLPNRSVPTATDNAEGLLERPELALDKHLRCSTFCRSHAQEEMVTDGLEDMKAVYHEDSMESLLINAPQENASVVGSSLRESKHVTLKYIDRDRSFNKDDEDSDACSKGDKTHFLDDVGNTSPTQNGKTYVTRYFIIKSLSHQNIQMSVEKGVWATQVMNEPILEEAFHNSDRVILIFSVNMSGFFQGYAEMISSLGLRQDNVWNNSGTRNKPWGRSFEVKWLRLQDLPLQKTLHLKNPLNDFKPVKISRDCQELSEDIGEALCALFDEEVVVKRKLMRNDRLVETVQKRPFRISQDSLSENHVPCHSSMDLGMAGATLLHLPYLHQHSSHYRKLLHDVRPQRYPIDFFSHESPAHNQKSSSNKKQEYRKDAADIGGFASSLCEEDILDMTYEEYLQAIRRTSVSSSHMRQSWNQHGVQMNRSHDGSL